MIVPAFLSVLGVLAGAAVAQTFEPADFNVTEALLDLGVNVTQLPELSDLVERSGNHRCAAAVSQSFILFKWLDLGPVEFDIRQPIRQMVLF